MDAKRPFLWITLLGLLVLHCDWWLWREAGLVFGLPAGLAYHIGFCLLTVVAMASMVKWAWPFDSDDEEGSP